ncbi:MAG: hypothetical protein D6722_01030 [Bacteroidetes bacterium]|nr:MAG: hypothetical protein D6722_01030 [Bacteroidota bacterium]
MGCSERGLTQYREKEGEQWLKCETICVIFQEGKTVTQIVAGALIRFILFILSYLFDRMNGIN